MPDVTAPRPTAPHLLTTAEVAEALGISARTVRALASRGELRPVRIGRRITRYRAEDVAALVEERLVPAPA